jgi:hypothetical protein
MSLETPLPAMEELVRITQREREMIDANKTIEVHKVAALVFALLAGLSAVSTAVIPAIVNI